MGYWVEPYNKGQLHMTCHIRVQSKNSFCTHYNKTFIIPNMKRNREKYLWTFPNFHKIPQNIPKLIAKRHARWIRVGNNAEMEQSKLKSTDETKKFSYLYIHQTTIKISNNKMFYNASGNKKLHRWIVHSLDALCELFRVSASEM